MASTGITIHPVTPTIGAEVRGLDLREPLTSDQAAEVRQALLDHLVLFFRDQDITPAQQLAFTEALGPVMLPVIDTRSTEAPGVTVLDQTAPKGEYTDNWHTDHLFLAEPPMASMLRAVELPPVGGDTCFASMYAAYEALSPRMQAFLQTLTAVHSMAKVAASFELPRVFNRSGQADHVAEHPLVRVHPETGRRLLFLSENFTTHIVDLEQRESRALLELLFAHLNQVRFQCRFRWEPHSIAVWDNRAAHHCAVYDYQERRLMYRTMIAGDRPFGVEGPGRSASLAAPAGT